MGRDLAQRVDQNAVAQSSGDAPTVFTMLEQMKPEMAKALPAHMNAERMARIGLTVIRQTPALGRCEPASLLGALMTCAQLGLEPGPLGEAYLVPYGNQVTFIPGYRGLIKLAWQSGQLTSIAAHTVHENDDFDYEYGLDPKLRHKPALTSRGKVIAVYAAAVFKNGGSAFIVMSIEDVEKIRERSRAGKNGPWKTDYDAMARKTAVRQLIRWLPLSSELSTLQTAAQADGAVRTEVTASLDEAPMVYPAGEIVQGDVVEETAAASTDDLKALIGTEADRLGWTTTRTRDDFGKMFEGTAIEEGSPEQLKDFADYLSALDPS